MKKISRQIVQCFKNGGKLLLCGNGGSAAMSQEMAAELLCGFENRNRPPLRALSLTTDTSIITAQANDYTFESIFGKQVVAWGDKGDILIVFSSSGRSKNCLYARDMALFKEMSVIDFPREGKRTADIQEYQHKLMHQVCREVEKEMFS